MRERWVDNDVYLGPCRRQAGRLRLHERRREDEAGELPPLGALLRRLRVRLMLIEKPEERERAQQLARAAMAQALARGLYPCAAAIRDAAQAITAARDASGIAAAETAVLRAMALAESYTP